MAVQNAVATVKKETVDIVAARIKQFQNSGELRLPANYSPENALKSAWLILQETVDKDKKPALAVCTKESIANSLLDMVVQGLNPAKKQGYFIVYGNKLTFQRSYFGTMAVTKQVDDTIEDVFSEVVYEDDVFKYKINRGRKEITEHEQSLENINGKKIKAAYCMIIDTDGQVKRTEIMTFDEIKQAWKQSKMFPIDANGNIKVGSTHDKFTAEMCKKTVTNKACKPIINSSDDGYLFKQSVNRTSEIIVEEDVADEIAANANKEVIDIVIEDAEFTEPKQDNPNGPAIEVEVTPPTEKPKDTPPTTDGPDF